MHCDTRKLSALLAQRLNERKQFITTAESCTGGLIATTLTDRAGSSSWFERAFVAYSNEAKIEMLGVRSETLHTYGAVSEPVVLEMAQGAILHSRAQIAISVSGIAGPSGGNADKPVGTVWFGFATDESLSARQRIFSGDRVAVREQSLCYALSHLLQLLQK